MPDPNTVSPGQLMQVATQLQENIEEQGRQVTSLLDVCNVIMGRIEALEKEVLCLKEHLQLEPSSKTDESPAH